MATECKCLFRVKVAKGQYECVRCKATYGQPLNGQVYEAPGNWNTMDADRRAIWAAREMLGAQL